MALALLCLAHGDSVIWIMAEMISCGNRHTANRLALVCLLVLDTACWNDGRTTLVRQQGRACRSHKTPNKWWDPCPIIQDVCCGSTFAHACCPHCLTLCDHPDYPGSCVVIGDCKLCVTPQQALKIVRVRIALLRSPL